MSSFVPAGFPGFILLTLLFLCTGCFTESFLGKDELPPDNRTVVFHLVDGARIKSPSGKHRRVDEGFQIFGEVLNEGKILKTFDGVVRDDEITGVTVQRYNAEGTLALVGGAIVVGVLVLTRWGTDGP